ncbi:hypothetical protein BKA70DRAFT_1345463 [Coprinopsis sp. MPI-PUGE-AT-0042]|nr:hypothetical protein BKA70DRAFT_1345463 [Coprinopsis sp. MPI-PUGE-AT-0042]
MEAGSSLPTYAAAEKPPQYAFPSSFSIGGKQTEGLLVTIPQIKGHLTLLHSFMGLKHSLEFQQATEEIPDMPGDRAKRWVWFVHVAVERFNQWVQVLYPQDEHQPFEDILPPLDVLMVWHSYMLNPRWYMEDLHRLPPLALLQSFGQRFADNLDRLPEILSSPLSQARVAHFQTRLQMSFDPLESSSLFSKKTIMCPRCQTVLHVPCMEWSAFKQGRGYFQHDFLYRCTHRGCGLEITKDTLRARKLAENLARAPGSPQSFLPGTFFASSSFSSTTQLPVSDEKASNAIKGKFAHVKMAREKSDQSNAPGRVDELFFKSILVDAEYSIAKMRGTIKVHKLLGRVMSAHLEPMIYSVDLAGAVIRQGSFVQKMHDFEWTKPNFFAAPEDEAALQHALARYHAFLDLLASSPANFFVPTLDIDLVWHTHQLCAATYMRDCRSYIGRFIDHDDKVDNLKLSNAFDITCRAWKDRFGVPYTYCGCPLPGDTIGQRLKSRLHLSVSSSKALPPSELSPPPDRPDLLFATHASEHNGVMFQPRNPRAHTDMHRRWTKHQEKMKKRAAKQENKVDSDKDDSKFKGCHGYQRHTTAFLYPVPMVYSTPVACVTGSDAGTTLSHAGACGNVSAYFFAESLVGLSDPESIII